MVKLKKHHYEVGIIIVFSLLFLALVTVTIGVSEITDGFPLEYSIFFFGLVNFNIIILLLLAFLIFRNVVRIFSEKNWSGSLKGKLTMAFVGFSVIPTAIIFAVSVFYITTFVEKWSNPQLGKALRSAIDISSLYVNSMKEKNRDLAHEIKEEWGGSSLSVFLEVLSEIRKQYNLEAIEYYNKSEHGLALDPEMPSDILSRVPSKLIEYVMKEQTDMSDMYSSNGQSFIRFFLPVNFDKAQGVIVVTSLVPHVIHRNIGHIEATYKSLRNDRSPLVLVEPFYVVILVFITLVLLFCAMWLGFYLARQLVTPIESLTEAAKGLSAGQYRQVKDVSPGSPEIQLLVNNFNKMVDDLEKSQRETSEVHENLKKTLARLDEHSRYIEIVISNVSAGVVSVDKKGIVTMINSYAARLFQIEAKDYVGRKVFDILEKGPLRVFNEIFIMMKEYDSGSVQKEINIMVGGRVIPIQMTLIFLNDDSGQELGKVFVLNDLSDLISAQKSAAWKEVARRIAHEIKNPLTPIRLSAQRLQRKFGKKIEDPAFHDGVEMIIRQADDLRTLVNEFSRFARLPQSQPIKSSLNKVISEALVLFVQAHKSVKFVEKLDDSLPEFMFDPDQIKRVITNLVNNALAATQSVSSEITISTEYDPSLKIVRISVIDNGVGIPPTLIDRVFEPYVTTKKDGTGLGLSIVRRLVEDHNGFIRAFHGQHSGTRVVIELPVIVSTTHVVLSVDESDREKKGEIFV